MCSGPDGHGPNGWHLGPSQPAGDGGSAWSTCQEAPLGIRPASVSNSNRRERAGWYICLEDIFPSLLFSNFSYTTTIYCLTNWSWCRSWLVGKGNQTRCPRVPLGSWRTPQAWTAAAAGVLSVTMSCRLACSMLWPRRPMAIWDQLPITEYIFLFFKDSEPQEIQIMFRGKNLTNQQKVPGFPFTKFLNWFFLF